MDYRITIDKDACDGIFACLTRDPRFVEGEEGLATVDPDADPAPPDDAGTWVVDEDENVVVAEFEDDGRVEEARRAAAACPPGAITVEER